jgi:hypothetical protein
MSDGGAPPQEETRVSSVLGEGSVPAACARLMCMERVDRDDRADLQIGGPGQARWRL